jgi:hypothetical protein
MKLRFFLPLGMLALLGACTSLPEKKKEIKKPETPLNKRERRDEKMGGPLFGEPIFTTAPKKNESIGINSYLWKATLDALAFLPKHSTDPFGGTVITEWYSPIETPKERLKIEVLILGRELKSDAIKVSIFRQKKDKKNEWTDQSVDPQTVTHLEDAILTRARELRLSEEK